MMAHLQRRQGEVLCQLPLQVGGEVFVLHVMAHSCNVEIRSVITATSSKRHRIVGKGWAMRRVKTD